MVAKGECPYDLGTQLVPEESWEGWERVATDLGITVHGQSSMLVFKFVMLMEHINSLLAAGNNVSDQDREQRDLLLRHVNDVYEVRMLS